MRFLSAAFLMVVAAMGGVVAQQDPPTQLHIAYAGTTGNAMSVSYATTSSAPASFCMYGTQQGGPYSQNATGGAPTTHSCLLYTSPYQHHVILNGLTPNTKYYYVCGDATYGSSAEHSFVSSLPASAETPYVLAIVGDIGQTQYSNSTVHNMIANGAFNSILCVGDLAYADGWGPRWDSWATMIEPLISEYAFMTTPGNHEQEIWCLSEFVAYNTRMRMPYPESGSTSQEWYSYETGPLHIISISSYSAYDTNSAQYAWVKSDLATIDRTKTPWVLVMQHVPWYNSNSHHQGEGAYIQSTYEELFYNAQVDIVYSGHVHAYERSKKVYDQAEDPKGMVHITIGDGGNREGLAEPWQDPQPDWSAFRQAAYGYGMLTIPNSTHALWEWHRDEDGLKVITDSVWVVKGQPAVIENIRPVMVPISQWKKWNSGMW